MRVADVTHVVVGFSSSLLAEMDRMFPPGSVLLLEEPSVIESRRVNQRVTACRAVAEVIPAPTQDEAHAESLADMIGRPPAVRAVIPALEYGVVAAAALADAWGLPGAGLRAARVFRDKEILRNTAEAAGIDQPVWRRVQTAEEVEQFRSRSGRCVLKPTGRQGSVGVQLLGPEHDIGEAWRITTGVIEPKMRAEHYEDRYLVEELIEGPEVSVEALVRDGEVRFLNTTAKHVLHGRFPVEIGHCVPAALELATRESLGRCMERLVKASGFRTGILHGEWILRSPGLPCLVECAARVPGDDIDRLINLAYGCDLVDAVNKLLEGEESGLPCSPQQGAAIRYLTSPEGRVQRVSGVEQARAADGVLEAEVALQPGDISAQVTCSTDRIGYVIAFGATSEEAFERCAVAESLITIEVEST